MISSIQLLRAIAAIIVVMYHITVKADQYHNNALAWFNIGEFGVDLFFIISGFIMCYTTARRNVTFGRFMRDRIKRILPLYWIMTTVALVVYIIAPSMVNASGGETSVISSYTLIPLGDKLLVQNGWTLSYEFLFYLVFAGFLATTTTGKNLAYTTGAIGLLALFGLVLNPEYPTLQFLTNTVLLEFVLGMAAFKILHNKKLPLIFCTGLLIAGGTILALQNQNGIYYTFMGRLLNGGMPMFFIFVGFVGMERYIAAAQFKFKRGLLLLGDASYSIYLIHPFTLSASAKIVKKAHLAQNSVVFTAVLLLTSVAAGVIVYWFVERPVNHYFKRHKVNKTAPGNIAAS